MGGGLACASGGEVMAAAVGAQSLRPFAGIGLPGVELSVAARDRQQWGVAVIEGDLLPHQGVEAFRALVRRQPDLDARALAVLAILFIDPAPDVAGHLPWPEDPDPDRMPEQQRLAAPPVVSGRTLTYWRWHGQMKDLVRCEVDLDALTTRCLLADEVAHPPATDPYARAVAALALDSVPSRIDAVLQLPLGADGRAGSLLLDRALNDPAPDVREAAVQRLPAVPPPLPGRVEGLSRILLYDGQAAVRRAAADSLGQLLDPAGRPALLQAAAGDGDARVRDAARMALTRLPATGGPP